MLLRRCICGLAGRPDRELDSERPQESADAGRRAKSWKNSNKTPAPSQQHESNTSLQNGTKPALLARALPTIASNDPGTASAGNLDLGLVDEVCRDVPSTPHDAHAGPSLQASTAPPARTSGASAAPAPSPHARRDSESACAESGSVLSSGGTMARGQGGHSSLLFATRGPSLPAGPASRSRRYSRCSVAASEASDSVGGVVDCLDVHEVLETLAMRECSQQGTDFLGLLRSATREALQQAAAGPVTPSRGAAQPPSALDTGDSCHSMSQSVQAARDTRTSLFATQSLPRHETSASAFGAASVAWPPSQALVTGASATTTFGQAPSLLSSMSMRRTSASILETTTPLDTTSALAAAASRASPAASSTGGLMHGSSRHLQTELLLNASQQPGGGAPPIGYSLAASAQGCSGSLSVGGLSHQRNARPGSGSGHFVRRGALSLREQLVLEGLIPAGSSTVGAATTGTSPTSGATPTLSGITPRGSSTPQPIGALALPAGEAACAEALPGDSGQACKAQGQRADEGAVALPPPILSLTGMMLCQLGVTSDVAPAPAGATAEGTEAEGAEGAAEQARADGDGARPETGDLSLSLARQPSFSSQQRPQSTQSQPQLPAPLLLQPWPPAQPPSPRHAQPQQQPPPAPLSPQPVLEAGLLENPLQLMQGLSDLRFLACGAQGTVYVGNWRGLPVAVKFLTCPSLDLQSSVVCEALVASELQHPNVIRTYFTRVARFSAKALAHVHALHCRAKQQQQQRLAQFRHRRRSQESAQLSGAQSPASPFVGVDCSAWGDLGGSGGDAAASGVAGMRVAVSSPQRCSSTPGGARPQSGSLGGASIDVPSSLPCSSPGGGEATPQGSSAGGSPACPAPTTTRSAAHPGSRFGHDVSAPAQLLMLETPPLKDTLDDEDGDDVEASLEMRSFSRLNSPGGASAPSSRRTLLRAPSAGQSHVAYVPRLAPSARPHTAAQVLIKSSSARVDPGTASAALRAVASALTAGGVSAPPTPLLIPPGSPADAGAPRVPAQPQPSVTVPVMAGRASAGGRGGVSGSNSARSRRPGSFSASVGQLHMGESPSSAPGRAAMANAAAARRRSAAMAGSVSFGGSGGGGLDAGGVSLWDIISMLNVQPGAYVAAVVQALCDAGTLDEYSRTDPFRPAPPPRAPSATIPEAADLAPPEAPQQTQEQEQDQPPPSPPPAPQLSEAERDLVSVALQVASGMEYIHAAGVRHGDLKPGNVLLSSPAGWKTGMQAPAPGSLGLQRHASLRRRSSSSGVPAVPGSQFVCKVCDFGLTTLTNDDDSGGFGTAGAGTVAFAAPESLTVQGGFPADVWAFGILLYQLAAGRRPFENLAAGQIMFGVLHQGLRPEWPAGRHMHLKQLFERCIATEPRDRPTFEQIVSELNQLLRQHQHHQQHHQQQAQQLHAQQQHAQPQRQPQQMRSMLLSSLP